MDRSVPYLIVAFIGIAFVIYLMMVDRKRMQMQRLRVKKLYASPLYEAMRPMLRQAQKYSVESLIIDKTGFTFRFLFPYNYEVRFSLTEHGYPNLTVEKQEALLILMEAEVSKLTEHDCYSFRSLRKRLLDGSVEYRYQYIVQTDYKNLLIRAPYYDG
ncbi:MAG: hypothetical protein PHO41_07650 [Eubacteriales bacterium]|nr:hypothetical protein [Eubacteriales bacterium]